MKKKIITPLPEGFMSGFGAALDNQFVGRDSVKKAEVNPLHENVLQIQRRISVAQSGGVGDVSKLSKELSEAKRALAESFDLTEAKMSDADVLSAAKRLAANGKDEKAKAFGKGLVDFYGKNDSFTPDQVSGLQNIMKNASFHLAKEEVEEIQEKAPKIKDEDPLITRRRQDRENRGETKTGGKTKQPKWSVQIGKKSYTVSARNTAEASAKAEKAAKNEGNTGPYKGVKRLSEETISEKYAKETDKTDDGKGMDPVGKGDADIDNDGDSDKSDKYLHNRRKAIGKALKKESVELDEISKGKLKSYVRKAKDDASDSYERKKKSARLTGKFSHEPEGVAHKDYHTKNLKKRQKGINTAIKKLNK